MVDEGLSESRARAQALIRSGVVLVDDEPVDKPGTRIRDTARVRLRAGSRPRFVSRGGEKLAGALEDLGIDPRGQRWLDVGASTGGFSDCLLQAGAAHVVALDVGVAQLHERLRQDPRVHVLERTHAGQLRPDQLPGSVDAIAMDVSFTSARPLLAHLAGLLPRTPVLVMVKPQFEVGRERVGKGGVVRDPRLRAEAADAVAAAAVRHGYRERGRADSRLAGPKGNVEIFLWLVPGEAPGAAGEGEP